MIRSTTLQKKQVVALFPRAPFNFDASMHKPDHFPTPDNAWQPGVRWQTMLWGGVPLGLKFEEAGSVDRPRVTLSIWSEAALNDAFVAALTHEINYRYSLGSNLDPFNARFADDPHLGPIIARWRGMRPLNVGSLYEYLIIAIALQNATVRRSVQMMQALFESYGTLLRYDPAQEAGLHPAHDAGAPSHPAQDAGLRIRELYCFWPPEALGDVSEQALRELKVGYRARAIQRVTAAFVNRDLDEFALRRASRAQQRQALLGLYGIGPASVGYVLSDVFHHLDEFEHISPWEQKIYSRLFFDTDPEQPAPVERLLAHFDARFGGWRNLAVHYIWEDLFWKRMHEPVPWLEKLIRL
jgi:3-methyladenine DNA glycosylase/8-oxoguanine DNA glycosylase